MTPRRDPRKIALSILNRLDSGRKTLDDLMEEADARTPLGKKDRALLNALVLGTTRWRGRLDAALVCLSNIPLEKIDPRVLNALRMGLFQVQRMDKTPVSAAVNTSVDLVKTFSGPWVAKFVNAVLRNAARAGADEDIFPDFQTDPAGALAARKSFPKWLIRRWLDRMGPQKTAALCDAMNQIPPLTLRVNTLATDRDALIRALESRGFFGEKTRFSPDGVTVRGAGRDLFKSPEFQNGWFQVQDEAAQLVSYMLSPDPGRIILDACAGLGGKTGHLSQLTRNQGALWAMDKSEKKLAKLTVEMKRLGAGPVRTVRRDLSRKIQGMGAFDAILADAPCSGLGVLRRNPDAKWSASPDKIKKSAIRQRLFLKNLSGRVKPGGRLAYAACSMEPEENEEIVEAFLAENPGFTVDTDPPGLPEKARALLSASGFLKTSPSPHDMDGFFAVCFQKTGN
ncbi:16S rRNA (Cytosine(967)-C(5))-methyltransferase [Candidatus Desulfarcum epimagneticum]|uniref:16S rRNA (cytosine(967)-C(5))-methyltransferase n=1 Tax=uncultured Desulfobacteraceae bacterium TaxID=218296 RepID=A0A484HBB4_9BACT|nr:16S rRNA (Cytosine(967)-C(5))-methyltransferase [uncultured Desulfobacteraceae bacterium]